MELGLDIPARNCLYQWGFYLICINNQSGVVGQLRAPDVGSDANWLPIKPIPQAHIPLPSKRNASAGSSVMTPSTPRPTMRFKSASALTVQTWMRFPAAWIR
jgi:hypothetical protein